MDQTIEVTGTEQGDSARNDIFNQVSVGHVVYALVVIAAAVMRLVDLGVTPLSPLEAQEALAVWDLWRPGNVIFEVISPAYFTFGALLTQVLGFNDIVMRIVPALFGTITVALPWFLRHRSGLLG